MAQDSTIEYFKQKAWSKGWTVLDEQDARSVGRSFPSFEVDKIELLKFINDNKRKIRNALKDDYYFQVLLDTVSDCPDLIIRRFDLLLYMGDDVYWTEEKNAAVMPHDRKHLLRQAIIDCYLAAKMGEKIAWHYSGPSVNQFYQLLERLLREFGVIVIKDD